MQYKNYVNLLILTFFINYKFLLSFRITDFIILLTLPFLVDKIKINKYNSIFLFMFFISLFISIINGVLTHDVFNLPNFIFIYKYLLPFYLFIILNNIIEKEFIDYHLKIMNGVFIFLSLYAYLFVLLSLRGVFGSGLRPAFPFTNSGTSMVTDAHLYSAYLSNSLLFYYIISKINKSFNLKFILTFILSIGGILLTGSRNGILTFFITFTLINLYSSFQKLVKTKIKLNVYVFSFLIFCFVAFSFILPKVGSEFLEYIGIFIHRALNFNFFSGDESSSQRIDNLSFAIESSIDNHLFGLGLTNFKGIWVDGGITNLILYSGIIGFILFILQLLIIVIIRINEIKNPTSKYFLFIFIFHYLITNLISEFFLITRNIVPFIINLVLMIKLLKREDLKKNGSG